jgi:two-component system nitrogen regulation sensor histidine kinase GlnL
MEYLKENTAVDEINKYTFSTNRNLRINSWGKRTAEVTGLSPSQVLGKKYYSFLPRIFAGDTDAVFVAMKKGGVTLNGHRFNCFCSHEVADIIIKPVKARGGEVEGASVSIYVTSVCPTVKKLQEFQRLIEIGKIGSSLTHGIRNPLNAIKGAVVFLKGKYAGEPAIAEFTKLIEFETSRLDNFISRFLSASKPEAESETDINSLLREIEAYTALQLNAFDIKAVFEYGDIPSLLIDAFYLEQAILNIVNNSIDAMRSGGQLTVSTRIEKDSGMDCALIIIADTGPGMDETQLNEMSHRSEYKRSGHGMFVTQEILRYYGGHMEIESAKGSGTTVRLYIPINGSVTS